MIQKAIPSKHAGSITEIYNHYILNFHSTFEVDPVSEVEMMSRIEAVAKVYPWIIFEEDNKVLGYAYGSQWKPRAAYKFTVESSVYVHPEAQDRGVGKALYIELLKILGETKFRTVLAGISMPNEPSIALHENLGFVKCGQLPKVGYKFDKWWDVGYWTKDLNK